MTDPISDERLAEIRAGLEGVSKGPWSAYADDCAQCRKFGRLEANILGLPGGMHAQFDNLRDAEHVARLDPQTVAALLDEVERARALLSRLDKAEAGEPDEARIAAARERAEALGPGMPGIMRTAFADIAENAIRQYFRPLPPPPSSES